MTFNFSEQLAGVASIEFYLLTEAANWPVVLTDNNAAQVTYDPEENDIDGSITPNSITINDKPKNSSAGQIWPNEINFTYLARSVALEQLLEQYANLPGVAIACFNDGTQKLYGSDNEPVYMTWNTYYGTAMEDSHGTQVTIKGDSRQRPVYIIPS